MGEAGPGRGVSLVRLLEVLLGSYVDPTHELKKTGYDNLYVGEADRCKCTIVRI